MKGEKTVFTVKGAAFFYQSHAPDVLDLYNTKCISN